MGNRDRTPFWLQKGRSLPCANDERSLLLSHSNLGSSQFPTLLTLLAGAFCGPRGIVSLSRQEKVWASPFFLPYFSFVWFVLFRSMYVPAFLHISYNTLFSPKLRPPNVSVKVFQFVGHH